MNEGSCLCGAVGWRITGPVNMSVNCHCSMCRKAHGSAYASFAAVAAEDFEWLRGETTLTAYASSEAGKRLFCGACGSVAPVAAGDNTFVPIGNMRDDIERPIDSHIFVASKAPWFEITDVAPQFDAYPPGYDHSATEKGERKAETEGSLGGSCLCGDVRFEFDPPASRMLNCHCSRCRLSRSALHSTQVFVPADQFRWLNGSDLVVTYKVPDAKFFAPTFCERCGALVARVDTERNVAVLPAGCLDEDPEIRPAAHIFAASRSPSYRFTDDLPRYDEYPPS